MGSKMWFGNVNYAQWVPCPRTGMRRTRENFSQEISFRNGGRWIQRSAASSSRFIMDLPVSDASEYEGIEAYERFASGDYGSGFLYFVDPMYQDENLAPQHWAAPGLAEEGHKNIYDTTPTFVNSNTSGVATYHYPPRSAVYNVTSAANGVPANPANILTILIPPDSTLWFRWYGSVTGTAVMKVQPINLDGSLATDVDVSPVAASNIPSWPLTGYSGSTYRAVRIYLSRTSTAASTATLTAMHIQIRKTGVTPSISQHIPGKGHVGLSFTGDARAEEYIQAGRHLVGASFELAEVEAWQ